MGDYHRFLSKSGAEGFAWQSRGGQRPDSSAGRLRWQCECCADGPGRKVHERLLAQANGAKVVPKVVRRLIEEWQPRAVDFMNRPGYRQAIREHIAAQAHPRTRVIIAHSMGSLVAVDLLAHSDLRPDLLITLGTPLSIKALYRDLEPAHWEWIVNRDTTWVNIHHRSDRVTACSALREDHFPGVMQIRVRHDREQAHRFSAHLTHPPVAGLIDDVGAGRSPEITDARRL